MNRITTLFRGSALGNYRRRASAALAALIALLVSGCIDMETEIWIHEDGSGLLVLDLGISKKMEELRISLAENGSDRDLEGQARELEAHEAIRSASIEHRTEGEFSRHFYRLELTDITRTSEVMSLALASGPLSGGQGEGSDLEVDLDIAKTSSGTYRLTGLVRNNDPENPEEDKAGAFAAEMMKEMLGDAGLTFRLHSHAESHNGEEVDGAVQWSILFADLAMGRELVMAAEFRPHRQGGSARAAIGFGLGILTLLGGLVCLMLRGGNTALATALLPGVRYWVKDQEEIRGPFGREELLMIAKANRLTPQSHIAAEGSEQWILLSSQLPGARSSWASSKALAGALIAVGLAFAIPAGLALLGSKSRGGPAKALAQSSSQMGPAKAINTPKAEDPPPGWQEKQELAKPALAERPTIVTDESPEPEPRPAPEPVDQVELLSTMAEWSAAHPSKTISALQVAAFALWLEEIQQYEQTCTRMLEWAEGDDAFEGAERAVATICSLRPQPDQESRKRTVELAKRGVRASGKNALQLAWANLTLGMAEFQDNNDRAAHAALTAATSDPEAAIPSLIDTATFYMAMLYHRSGNHDEARNRFGEAENRIRPVPRDGVAPLSSPKLHDLLIMWLAYRQAGALLELPLRKGEAYWTKPLHSQEEMRKLVDEWSRLEGSAVIVPSNPRIQPIPEIILQAGDEIRLYPNPTSEWNSSPSRWRDTNFRGHHDYKELTKGGRPFMQLCYRIGNGPLQSVEPGAVVTGEGPLYLIPSDIEGGGTEADNTGEIQVKVTGTELVRQVHYPPGPDVRSKVIAQDGQASAGEGSKHYVVNGRISKTRPPEEEHPARGLAFEVSGPDSPSPRRPGRELSFTMKLGLVGGGNVVNFDRTASTIDRLVDSSGKDLGHKKEGESFSLGEKTDQPRFGMIMSGGSNRTTTIFVELGTPPTAGAEHLVMEGMLKVSACSKSEQSTTDPVPLKKGGTIKVGSETLEISDVKISEKGQAISLEIDPAGLGMEGIKLLDAAGQPLDPPIRMSIGDTTYLSYYRIDPPLEKLQFRYWADVKGHSIPYRLKIPLSE